MMIRIVIGDTPQAAGWGSWPVGPFADRLEGVAQQVEEDLFELVPIGLNQGKRLKQAL